MEVYLMNTIKEVLILITVTYFQNLEGKGQYEGEGQLI